LVLSFVIARSPEMVASTSSLRASTALVSLVFSAMGKPLDEERSA